MPVSSAPPNVVAGTNDLSCRLSSSPYASIPVPFYGSTSPRGPIPRSLSQPSSTPYARLGTNSTALYPGTAGWFTHARPIFRPSPYTVPSQCGCSLCKPATNTIATATTIFNAPVQSTWSSNTLLGMNSNTGNQFSGYMGGQRDDTWSNNGSPESCPDMSLSLPPTIGAVVLPKEEMISSSNSCNLSNANGLAS